MNVALRCWHDLPILEALLLPGGLRRSRCLWIWRLGHVVEDVAVRVVRFNAIFGYVDYILYSTALPRTANR